MTFHTPREERLDALEAANMELLVRISALEGLAARNRPPFDRIPGQLSVDAIRAAQPRRHNTHPPRSSQ